MRLNQRVKIIGDLLWKDYNDMRINLETRPIVHSGFVASMPDLISLVLSDLAGLGFNNRTFLDLGSGNGLVAMIAAVYGYDAHGIEINKVLVDRSKKLYDELRKKRVFTGTCTFVQGNYFPSDILEELRRRSPCERVRVETEVVQDPYEELGKRFSDFDIIFCFPWEEQVESVYNLFMQKGRPGQLFVSYSWNHEIEKHPNLKEVSTFPADCGRSYKAVTLKRKKVKVA